MHSAINHSCNPTSKRSNQNEKYNALEPHKIAAHACLKCNIDILLGWRFRRVINVRWLFCFVNVCARSNRCIGGISKCHRKLVPTENISNRSEQSIVGKHSIYNIWLADYLHHSFDSVCFSFFAIFSTQSVAVRVYSVLKWQVQSEWEYRHSHADTQIYLFNHFCNTTVQKHKKLLIHVLMTDFYCEFHQTSAHIWSIFCICIFFIRKRWVWVNKDIETEVKIAQEWHVRYRHRRIQYR